MNEFNHMDIEEFADFIIYAKEKEKEEKLYTEWCALLPILKKEYMSFSKFKEHMTGADIDTRPAEVIIEEIEEAHRKAGM